MERIEDRLVQLRSLQRKYGPSVEDVLTYHQTAIQQRDELLNHEANAERLKQALEDALQILQEHSERLHDMRRRAAAKLAKEVEKALRELNMPNALFEVAVTPRVSSDGAPQFGEDGSDHVQFLLSANAGEDAKPIQKVASGGELSRTLLALKSVLAEVDDLGTLIFDEIDAGVSGDTASRVAKMMQNVARKRQVLCVTHSAPVAAAGRWHYHIAKVEQRGRVTTLVKKLDEDGRIDELSRLLGGGIADHTAKTHARALLERMAEKGSAGER
ncbi:hypothetical protein GCM10025857_37740 [Alicyclobacillus contaminans]|nr:hypothetical protein GCM10025857_37740 [Alicyclobacillus contaminans]